MPELPEMEAWRRALDGPVSALSDREGRARAHRDAEDLRPAARGARGPAAGGSRAAREAAALSDRGRRARPARPPDDGRPPAVPARRARRGRRRPRSGSSSRAAPSSSSPRPGKKKRAGVWLLTPEAAEAELGAPRARGERARRRAARRDPRRRVAALHSLLRDQRVIAGIGRAWANEILHAAKLSPYALSKDLKPEEVERLDERDPVRAGPRPRAPRARARTTSAPTGSTASSPSPATCAERRSRTSTSRSTRSTTAPSARPAGGC